MRIAIVNDLPLAVEAIKRVLRLRPEYRLAWVAADGAEALQRCAADPPDLVLMDLIMPVMDGVEATRRIMARCPCAILVVTMSVKRNAPQMFEAMGVGALDAVAAPDLGTGDPAKSAAPLLAKLEAMSRLLDGAGGPRAWRRNAAATLSAASKKQNLLALGASAGGPGALAAVLGQLPKDLPAAVVIVQHVDAQFALSLAEWLSQQSALPVHLARQGDTPRPGHVLLAAQDDHLVFLDAQHLGYTPHPRACVYRPSVDVFFESVVRHWAGEAVGVILTGMGRDGALGLKRLREAGFHTLAQDQASSAVYGMPKAAAQLHAAVEILPLNEIAPALVQWCRVLM